ncbi:STAS domain-containing protein [Pseudoroseicyclus tamaricis]|uniref:STAS domain-containing protein n=1 Tax=Pseudoroseicyclus tamaricis TaxID=2705421 RepID=A0A6B2K527_9RHOB|nr:STAS domain-containing protein [Pseudoroseicyclus tamaricis]NDV01836.1 STAS domain-containing protein [Pseudoroseicyclus tamaricis]
MTETGQSYRMEAQRAQSGADPLYAFLKGAAGGPAVIDLSEVGLCDAQRLQILVSASRHWRAAGASLRLTGAGEAFMEGLELSGLDPAEFDFEDK